MSRDGEMGEMEVRAETERMVREVLERVADKWTLLVLDALEDGNLRFTELKKRVPGVSQKMLTKTLRQLERDGLVTRRIFPEVPPRVEYRLTERGFSLNQATCAVWMWVEANAADVERSRREYDARPAHAPSDAEADG